MENAIRNLQKITNYFIDKESKRLVNAIDFKLKYLDEEQQQISIRHEIIISSEKLAEILRHAPILQSICRFINTHDFLWESAFIEHLNIEEKRKYRSFNISILDYREFQNDNKLYNEDLPYFSYIINFISLSQYIEYLQYLKKEDSNFKNIVIPKKDEKAKNEHDVKLTLNSRLTELQIKKIVQCINEIGLFVETITTELFNLTLSCSLKEPLRINKNKNKLLAYLLSQLDYMNLISDEWQSICSKSRLFMSFDGTILKQNNYSATLYDAREFPPKYSNTIDKYLKELKAP